MQKWHFSRILIAAALISGCATPQHPSLTEAHRNYNNALMNPQVTEMAALELEEANKFLNRADLALKKGKDAKVDHLAYMANQQVAIAQETAKAKVAESKVANANAERDRVLLEARTAEADEARRQLEELKAKKTERGLVITLSDILFRTNMAQLETGGMRTVQKLADFLKQYPQRTVLIEGHTDSTGSHNYNQELSDRRAYAVQRALINNGVSSDRITSRGYGETFPVASNDTFEGRQLNRRVEVILSEDGGSVIPR
ncbi:OmpA family protein [Nitrosomonas sp. Nm166]|uniref:OmpA family protein n=1 Tax=Nitrosomonas sp. Nm166 TaxID=1881054 RepID=UPI0008E0AD55|nr:OmpA family protein [Nitrosomonas sp. Nm166]SFE12029.1 Outer membrane protein OmpA [Nitrosomonas sp. Nm166]